MTLRVVCDTNVLVSALVADGPPSRVVEAVVDGRVELVLPDAVLEELERVLTAKLGFDDDDSRAAQAFFERLATTRVPRAERTEPVSGDPDDDAVLAAAVACGADVVVTGDRKHLLPLGRHRGVRLLTPQALLVELR